MDTRAKYPKWLLAVVPGVEDFPIYLSVMFVRGKFDEKMSMWTRMVVDK